MSSLIETDRLSIRHMRIEDDEAFVLELLNDSDFINNIADRGVRTLDDARAYIQNGPLASYARNGFGLYTVTLKESGVQIGICGLIRRPELPDVDIGYAFLERYRGSGYATEAAAAVLDYGYQVIGLTRIIAIVKPGNQASGRVLERIGLKFDGVIHIPALSGDSWLYVPPTP